MVRLRGLLVAASLGGAALPAQPPLVVTGRVLLVTGAGERPVARARVILHRIAVGSAGPVDSAVTGGDGRYAFRVDRPDSTAMYLATSRHGGIAYFAPPLHSGDAAGPGEIEVFDTTSAPVRIRVGGRHLVVSAADPDGVREIVEVYEVQNDSVVTRLGTRQRPSFVASLPALARNVRATQGDFTGEAVTVRDGAVHVVAPIAPGVRQLALAYALPPAAFPLRVPLSDTTGIVEVLLEEEAGSVTADSMEALGAVSSEGRSFVRFLGRDLPAGREVLIQLPGTRGASPAWPWLAVLATATAAAIAWSLLPARVRHRARPVSVGPPNREADLRSVLAGVDALLASPETAPASLTSLRAYRNQLARDLEGVARDPTRPE
jgi:hypothetical protein